MMMRKCVVCNTSVASKALPVCKICKKNPFSIEEARDFFAKRNLFRFFKKTYTSAFSELQNINTPEFWDSLLTARGKKEDAVSQDRIKIVLGMIEAQKGKLLDVGFGKGLIEEVIEKQKEFKLYGIDISEKAVKKMKKKIQGDFRVGSILKIPFDNNSFDVVLALEVLEHISPHDTFKALKEIKRVLKKEGILAVSVPLNEKLEEMLKNKINPSGHVRVYTPEIIKAELQIGRFQVKKSKYVYAFRTLYWIKKILQKKLLKNRWSPNDIIILAQKP